MSAEPIQIHTSKSAAIASSSAGCACGHSDEAEALELDTRVIPHAIRHATIFGALDAVAVGISLDLLANHMPAPLLSQLEQRSPGAFETELIESGPELWRLRLTRVAHS